MLILISLVYMVSFMYLAREILFLKRHIKKNDSSLKHAFKQISRLITSSDKTVKLVQKMQDSNVREIGNIIHDLDNLYKFNAKQNDTIKLIMNKHNDFVNEVLDDIRDLHCDLNDCDCSTCSYQEYCSSNKEETSNISSDSPKEEDEGPIICKENNQITIDLSVKGAFNKLEKIMCKSGIPKEIVDNYLSYIKNICPDNTCSKSHKILEIVWMFGKNPEAGVIKHKFINKDKDDSIERLIDPDSKIVKTLNNLYNKK